MSFKKASIDDIDILTELMLMAMGDIVYKFIGIDTNKTPENDLKATQFLKQFVSTPNNQYSYQNCWVWIEDNEIQGMANVYDGKFLEELRFPILSYIQQHYNTYSQIDNETEAGEMYLDTIAVYPKNRGKGLGEKMLKSLIEFYVIERQQILGLLVDEDNPKAKRLYFSVGFQYVKDKTLVGKKLSHLQYKL